MIMSLRRPSVRKQTPLHCGWLTKQGGMVKNWKPRWFCIRGDHIYYYQKEDEIKLLGDIPLPGNEIVELPANPDEPGKYFFQIKPGKDRQAVSANHTVYTFFAKNESERQEWISVIHRVLYSHVGGGVFGQSIQQSMEYERRSGSGRVVPRIVEDCIEYLKTHGLQTEGIFRLPGAAGTVRRLKQEYNAALPSTLADNGSDVHSVASLLKLFLRELPEPVIPFVYYEDFTTMGLKIQWDPDNAMSLLHDKLTQLPRDNYNCLKYISSFLHDVCRNSDSNRMTDSNIAMMFGPNLLRTDDENPMLMLSTADLNTMTVRMLISHYEQVFQRDYYDVEVSQRRGGVPDINNVDDMLTHGDSPGSSGLPSPILPNKHLDESCLELSRKSSKSSLSELDGPAPEESGDELGDHVCFRLNSVTRDSRKKSKRENIFSQQKAQTIPRARPEPPPRKLPEVPPKKRGTLPPPVPPRTDLIQNQKNSGATTTKEPKPSAHEQGSELITFPVDTKTSDPDYDFPTAYDALDGTGQTRTLPSDIRSIRDVKKNDIIPSELVNTTEDVIYRRSRVTPRKVNNPFLKDTNGENQDLVSEEESPRTEVEKLLKIQSNLGRIYQRQMDAQLSDMEQSYEKKISLLNDKLKQEKQATNLAVERLAGVHAELERYQRKYGPLSGDESDEG